MAYSISGLLHPDSMPRKVVIVLAGAACMCFLVYGTFYAKQQLFGSTPAVYATVTGLRYAIDTLAAMFEYEGSRLIGSAAGAFGIGGKPSASLPNEGPARTIPVLTYHRVVSDSNDLNNVTISNFRDQMRALKKAGWSTVTLSEFEEFMQGERELPQKSFLLTFDDGAKESFYPVDPILRALGFNASIFIIVRSSETPESTYYLSPEEIKQLLSSGRWSIGSHSYDGHQPNPAENGGEGVFFADKMWLEAAGRLETDAEFRTRVRGDLARAKSALETRYSVPIYSLAFPLGNETGIEGAANFPEGSEITEDEARGIYEFGFIQTENQTYTANFPRSSESSAHLANDFLVRRIHVDHDWDGERLLTIMENSLPKQLPFEDDFREQKGWLLSWGTLESGRNNFVLTASNDRTSASAFLDGSALWDDYSFDVAANWQGGHAFLLADVVDSRTYDACAFSPGSVRVQRTVHGVTTTLAEKKDERIQYGENARLGIRAHGSVIECTWGFQSIVEMYDRNTTGGVGIQIWDPELGKARVQVSSVIARPYVGTSTESE
ncbi:polysaccharide deacetylase family protein [Candidatus Kaiserbacteria bacterium]|nr:polysaccharide deacetylase family protein [Candidatus Kaiserbacteria bacterium]